MINVAKFLMRIAIVVTVCSVIAAAPIVVPTAAHAQGFDVHFYLGPPPALYYYGPPPAYEYAPPPPDYNSSDWYYYCRDAYAHSNDYAIQHCRSYYYWHRYGY